MDSTPEKILSAACAVFAERGYHSAKIQDICSQAEVNVASISYYFRGKANLYLAVWEFLVQGASSRLSQQLAGVSRAEERLSFLLRSGILAISGSGPGVLFAKIVHHETGSPSPLYADLQQRYLEPIQGWFTTTITDYLGPGLDSRTINCCLLCVYGPLLDLMNFRLRWERMQQDCVLRQHPLYRNRPAFLDDPEPLIAQMRRYCLGGLDALRRPSEKSGSR